MRKKYLLLLIIVFTFNSLHFLFAQAAVDIGLTVSDNLGNTKPMAFGLDPTATNGIDPLLGEGDLSPFPPGGIFEARFDLTPYAGIPLNSYKDYRNASAFPFTGVVQHRLIWQLGAGASSLSIAYNMPWYAALQIQDEYGGILINSPPLTGTGTYLITIPVTGVKLNINYNNALGPKLLSPSGGETWATGEQHSITWAVTYANFLKIQYSTDSGNEWIGIANNIPSAGGSYLWSVPNTPSQHCRVKISDAADTGSYDVSASDFIISDSSLIAYYSFTGNAVDETGHGYNGIVSGAALTADRFGNPGKAYSFDGVNDYIDLSSTENLNFASGGFSFVFWLNYTDEKEMVPVNKHNYNTAPLSGYGFSTYPAPRTGFFLHMDPTRGISTAEFYNDGKWHLAAGTYNGSTMKLYVDGQLKGTFAASYSNYNNVQIRVGKYSSNNPDPNYCFKGKIDDISIYNRALTDQEIQSMYTALPGIPELIFPANNIINQPLEQIFCWHSSSLTENYHLQVAADPLFTNIVFEDSSISDTVRNVSGLTNNYRYFWRVRANNYYTVSSWSLSRDFYTVVKPPDITSVSSGGEQITLNWTQDPLSNIASYKIFRDTSASAAVLLTTIDSTQSVYTDTSFPANVYYYYRLKSVSIYGHESDFSNEVSGLPAETFQLSVNIVNNWNIVSIPGLLPYNQNVISWWSGKDPAANVFGFQGNYQAVTVVEPGRGYWMKHLGANLYNTGEEWPAVGIQRYPHNPINVSAGWNLIGGYEQQISAAGLTTTPPGLIASPVYKYSAGYQTTNTMEPGYGYWIKLTGAGSINLVPGPAKPANNISKEDFGKIIITDKTRKSYTLYAVNGEADLTQFELPPLPPQNMFDIRYSTQTYAENLSTIKTIEMQGIQYPVKLRADGVSIILSDEKGKEIARLKSGDEVTLNTTDMIYVTEDIIPAVYSLEQNYPNPFNPNTTIQFSIPEDVQNVRLMIYGALGEKIAELVNTGLKAGVYKYLWDAGSAASGMYICQLVTGKFVSTKKMILMK